MQLCCPTVAVFNDLRSETVIWRRGLLSTPKVVTVSLDLLHDILEALTGLEITIRQKPLTSARFSGLPISFHDWTILRAQ